MLNTSHTRMLDTYLFYIQLCKFKLGIFLLFFNSFVGNSFIHTNINLNENMKEKEYSSQNQDFRAKILLSMIHI